MTSPPDGTKSVSKTKKGAKETLPYPGSLTEPRLVPNDGVNHLAVCRIRFSIPPTYWHSVITRRLPGTKIDVLGYSLMDDRVLMDVRVHTPDFTAWVDELRGFEGVDDVTPLVRSRRSKMLRITYKHDALLTTIRRLHLILRMPFTIMDGFTTVLVAGPESGIQRFLTVFPLEITVEAVYIADELQS
jgi:hypothetical protein